MNLSVPVYRTKCTLAVAGVGRGKTGLLPTKVAPCCTLFLSRHHFRLDGHRWQSIGGERWGRRRCWTLSRENLKCPQVFPIRRVQTMDDRLSTFAVFNISSSDVVCTSINVVSHVLFDLVGTLRAWYLVLGYPGRYPGGYLAWSAQYLVSWYMSFVTFVLFQIGQWIWRRVFLFLGVPLIMAQSLIFNNTFSWNW